MIVEYGIMSSKWSIEADDKLTAYATILISQNRRAGLVVIYNEELKSDNWAFADDLEKRVGEIFGGSPSDFHHFVNTHKNEIRKAFETIKNLCSMKENEVPDKIYLTKIMLFATPTIRTGDNYIEYANTDAFIKKACEWLKNNLENYYYLDEAYDNVISIKNLNNDFKKYMKGE